MHIKHVRPILLVFGLIILGITLGIMLRQTFSKNVPSVEAPQQVEKALPFKLTSTAFDNGGSIPATYTCTQNAPRVPLAIINPPQNAKEFALVVRDDSSNNAAHWVVWNIPANATGISETALPKGSIEGTNIANSRAYVPPCSESGSGIHTYTFDLFALSDKIQLDPSATPDSLLAAINGKVIAKTQLTGTVSADNSSSKPTP